MHPCHRLFVDPAAKPRLLSMLDSAIELASSDGGTEHPPADAATIGDETLSICRSAFSLEIVKSTYERCFVRLYNLEDSDRTLGTADFLRKWRQSVASSESEGGSAERNAHTALHTASLLTVLLYCEAGVDEALAFFGSNQAHGDEIPGLPPDRFLVSCAATNGEYVRVPDVLHEYLSSIAPPFDRISKMPEDGMMQRYESNGSSFVSVIDDLNPLDAMRLMQRLPPSLLEAVRRALKPSDQ